MTREKLLALAEARLKEAARLTAEARDLIAEAGETRGPNEDP
jgi:hypothetical protein